MASKVPAGSFISGEANRARQESKAALGRPEIQQSRHAVESHEDTLCRGGGGGGRRRRCCCCGEGRSRISSMPSATLLLSSSVRLSSSNSATRGPRQPNNWTTVSWLSGACFISSAKNAHCSSQRRAQHRSALAFNSALSYATG